MKQRNSYLKTTNINANSSSEFLTILTNKLVDYGEKIYESRKKYINLLNQKIGDLYNSICGIEDLKLEYSSDFKDFDRDKILKKYQDNLNRDIILGKTTVGIHHDDIKFKLEGSNIKDYGSEGQQKNAIIAYKLTEMEIFYQIRGNYPILILDEALSEVDYKLESKISTGVTTINFTFRYSDSVTELPDDTVCEVVLFFEIDIF